MKSTAPSTAASPMTTCSTTAATTSTRRRTTRSPSSRTSRPCGSASLASLWPSSPACSTVRCACAVVRVLRVRWLILRVVDGVAAQV
jgi:hypothetical protein